eukprot:jgi/Botrbrau1/18615/Bobra.0367s0054.1
MGVAGPKAFRKQGISGEEEEEEAKALPHSQLPTCCTSCRVGPPRALPKTSRPAMLSCCRVSSRLWLSKPSLLKHWEGCMLMRWPCCRGSRGF